MMGLREYLLEKRKGRDESKAFVPEKSGSAPSRVAGVSCPELGKTSGLHAVGAWAARVEIAKLLEAGVDPSLVVKAVRSGKEGDSPLDLSPPMFTGEPTAEEVEPLSPKGSKASPPSPRKFEVDEASELARLFGSSPQEQQLLLNEAGAFAGSPDWAEGSSPSILFRKRAEIPKDLNVQMVTKYSLNFLPPTGALQPPQIEKMSESFDTEGEESEEEQVGEAAVEEEDERSLDFKKKARLPMPEELKHPEEPVKPPPKRNYSRPADERDKLEKFYKRSLDLFEVLVVAGVKMDLVDLVVITKDDSKEPSIDEKRFRLHVEPKGAGTGLGYVRLMERLVKFHEDYVERDEEELTPVSRAAVLAFTEHLISEEAGFKTPKALLYALDFYSVSYGFRLDSGVMQRCRKLADTYSSKKPPRKGADFFQPAMLEYLEAVVNNEKRPLGDRLVAGRLRLCCQASVRHSDLTRTPLRDLETWNGVEPLAPQK